MLKWNHRRRQAHFVSVGGGRRRRRGSGSA